MAEFYEDMSALATDLIAEFGRPMALVSETLSDDYIPTVTETVTPVIGVQSSRTVREPGGLITSTETWVLVDGQTEPTMDMRVRDGGVDYSIVDREEIKPGPIVTHYKVRITA